MEIFGKQLIIVGFALVALVQVVASVKAFKVSFAEGFWSLVVPGYLLVAMRRAGYYGRFFAVWGAGVVAIVIGTIALS